LSSNSGLVKSNRGRSRLLDFLSANCQPDCPKVATAGEQRGNPMRSCRSSRVLLIPVLAAAMLTAVLPAATARDYDEREREAIRRAVTAGEIRSLADILVMVRARLPGEVAGVEIRREHSRWRYEFRVIGRKGRLYEVYVDAHTGKIERIREK
jgi:uncharacterized membrane protein YkoI